ncbi:hypothetical protein AAHA92_30334 [Salvia divinorum]|uniref:Protein SMG7L n=1 Tax=Salvia divinorum TaxID=28513 RepID=A0ABD1G281_SALDI
MELQKSFLEVVNAEKQMLELIYTKGILHDDVLELYHQIRAVYEKNLLNSNHVLELQEVEHHMWKLHYELIVEFRRRTRQRSHNGETKRNNGPPDSINSQSSIDKGLEEIKSFLSKSTEFYRNLIVKMRRACGLPAKVFLNNKDRWSFSIEPNKLHACQHTCHRLLICLGDLARYTEIIKKPDACEWSTAAMHYLEATRTWPDSGNPHNQLALLATYVGDPFLALYHCIRSLAVKEPFPDAWRNILLLFEENRSAKLLSVSVEMQSDFLNPSKRGYLQNKCLEKNGSAHNSNPADLDNICSENLEEYPCTLASALHSLDTLLAVDDTKLTVALESYQRLDSSRRGPYRAIQVVSIFIFIVHSLTESLRQEDSPTGKDDDHKHSALTPLAFTAIFVFMGRLTGRCVMGEEMGISPLLPTVLVFVEWLAGSLDMVQTYDADERVRNAMSYFFNALVGLLDQIEQFGNRTSLDHTALWEDHELRGFYPLNHVHVRLDFTTHLECVDNYSCRNKGRLQRIVDAAKIIKSKSRISHGKTSNLPEQVDVESALASHKADEKKSVAAEEEEVILFKPITRRNSAPLYISKATKDPGEPHLPIPSADEWLRRATSLSAGQNGEDADSFSFCPTSNSSDNRPTGPPSLSGWVLSKASSSTERDKEISGFSRQKLSPIDETASTSFTGLRINDTRDPERATTGHISTIVHDSPPYVAPVPSAPLLPDDASWMRGNSLIPPGADGILGAAPLGRPAVASGFVNGYPPLLGMSSSEWLYHYRNSQHMGWNPIPVNSAPAFGNEVSSFELCDQWGNRLVSNPMVYEYYVGEEEKRERMFLGYQRPFPYVCGVGMEVGHDQQPPLLQYLKEKERQLQPPSHPTFMGN